MCPPDAVGTKDKYSDGKNDKYAVGENDKNAVGENDKDAVGKNDKNAVGENDKDDVGKSDKHDKRAKLRPLFSFEFLPTPALAFLCLHIFQCFMSTLAKMPLTGPCQGTGQNNAF